MRIFFRDTESGEYYDQTNQLSLAELQSVAKRVQTDTNKMATTPEVLLLMDPQSPKPHGMAFGIPLVAIDVNEVHDQDSILEYIAEHMPKVH